MKQCTNCKEFKTFSEVDKDKSKKDGYCCWCKSCKKEYRQEHKVEKTQYKKNNRDKYNAYNAKRKALKLNQIPPGTDLKEVAEIYKLAQMLSIVLSIKMHVDHYIPLSRGGLHCPENLRIIPASENLQKGDKVPSEFYNQEKTK